MTMRKISTERSVSEGGPALLRFCESQKKGRAWFLGVSFLLGFSGLALGAERPKVFVEKWESELTGTTLQANLTVPPVLAAPAPKADLPIVLYLKNLSAPRVGTVDDETLLQEYREAGYGVVVLDYANHPQAHVPFLNKELGKLRDEIRAKHFLGALPVDPAHVFIIPAGCRLKRDLVFYRDENRTLAMDLIYPAAPAKPVGTVIEFSCDNKDRFGNTSLSICSDTVLDGEATQGYAVAMADHPVRAPYKGLDPMPDSAWKIKAAVRTLRAQSAALGLNGKISPFGFSRGSGMALMLVTTEGRAEFEGHGETPGESSAVQGAVVMSGRFTYLELLANDHMLPRYAQWWGAHDEHLDVWKAHGALDYLSKVAMPLFLSINISESPDALYQMEVLRRRLAALGNDEIFMMDRTPRGHHVPLDPEIVGTMDSYFKSRIR